MDNRAEVREFLTTRRARVSPEQVGLPAGTNRRVEGLHRSEVATLAGVSIEYYTRIERGTISGASPEVLDSLAKALCLDNAERAHLFDLAHAASPVARPPRRRNPTTWVPHQSLQWTLDAITAGPAFVRNGRMDILAVNTLARAFYKDLYDMPGQPPNIARYTFLDDRAHDFYPDWDLFAEVTVAILRTEAARDPQNKELHDLIGELSTRCEEFRRRWGAHNVRHHGTGVKTFHHPIVGELTLAYEGLEMAAEPGLTFTIYTAEPGSGSDEAMRLLASWAASEYEPRPPYPQQWSPAASNPSERRRLLLAKENPPMTSIEPRPTDKRSVL
jgi:transcriptional regulator with XRE-family HTH domain